MIDGLKLTMTGVQLRTNIEGRIRFHQDELRHLRNEHAIKVAERRIEVLTFIRDYLVADEVYRLGEFDLRFAGLLPDEDVWECGCVSPGFTPGALFQDNIPEPH